MKITTFKNSYNNTNFTIAQEYALNHVFCERNDISKVAGTK